MIEKINIRVRANQFGLHVPNTGKFLKRYSDGGGSYEIWQIDNKPEIIEAVKSYCGVIRIVEGYTVIKTEFV